MPKVSGLSCTLQESQLITLRRRCERHDHLEQGQGELHAADRQVVIVVCM